MPIRFSIFLPTGFGQEFARFSDPVEAYETLTHIGQTADRLGYETLWAPDHLGTIPPSQEFVFETWSVITGLARDTSRIRLGQLVTGNGYRNPALQAKLASSVDVVSHGRLTFGIGSGWYQPDYVGYGYEFGTAGSRLRQLDEAARIILSMWTEKETTFDGEYYHLREAVNQPKGVQNPHIPLLIAGGGEKVTLKLVAKYADASNVMAPPEVLAHKYAVLKKHCDDVGRDYDQIWRTSTSPLILRDTDAEARAAVPPGLEFAFPGDLGSYGLVGTLDTIRERIAAYEEAGVQELAVSFEESTNVELVRLFAAEYLSQPHWIGATGRSR